MAVAPDAVRCYILAAILKRKGILVKDHLVLTNRGEGHDR